MNKNQALIVVDVQNDFLESGALPVPNASEVIEAINRISPKFNSVLFTQDWHPKNHISFVNNHPGKKPFEEIEVNYGKQVLWSEHCVEETFGAKLASGLDTSRGSLFVKKGVNSAVDSYSAFLEADRKTKTVLESWLKDRGIEEVFICGLATDFCVSWTAQDAVAAGFKVVVVEDACRGISSDTVDLAKSKWEKLGICTVLSRYVD